VIRLKSHEPHLAISAACHLPQYVIAYFVFCGNVSWVIKLQTLVPWLEADEELGAQREKRIP